MEGRIKLHRQIINRRWFSKPNMFQCFLYFILQANHKDGLRQGIEVKRGQLVTGLLTIHKDTGLSLQTIRTCIKNLTKTGEILVKSTNKYSIITVVKYCDYNDVESEDNKQITNKQQTTNKQITTNKNDKNEKEGKEKKQFVPPTLQEMLDYFSEQGYSEEVGRRAWNGYAVANWHDSKGQQILNWKQKVNNVRFRPENKKKYTLNEYLQIEQERERDKEGATKKYGKELIAKAIEVYNQNN